MTVAGRIIGMPVPGCEGYSLSQHLPEKGIQRRWTLNGHPRSVEWCGGGIVKCADMFVDHPTPETLSLLLEECDTRQVERPSGYGDLFHKRHWQPPTRAAHRKLFPAGSVPGGWNAAPLERRVRSPLWKYDIRSAYLWALTAGLPHPSTFRTVRRVAGPGLYWVPSPCHPMLPHPWNKPGMFPATEDELLALPIDFRAVAYGVRFEPASMATQQWVDDIQAWSCWKAVGRSYWGRWVATSSATEERFNRDGAQTSARDLPDNRRNPIWAAIITSRLRLRLWQLWDEGNRRVYRVYTDSIVTDREVETGEGVGAWKLEEHYPHGAIVERHAVTPLAKAA